MWDRDAIRRAGINRQMHVIQTAASGGLKSNKQRGNYQSGVPAQQLDDNRLEGAASTALTYNSSDWMVTFQTSPGTGSGLSFVRPQKPSGEWLAPRLKRQACADWQVTDARKHNYRGWVLIPLHPPCLSPPALHPSSQLLWIAIVKRSNCAKWLQMHQWHDDCRQHGPWTWLRVFFLKPFRNYSLDCSRELSWWNDFQQSPQFSTVSHFLKKYAQTAFKDSTRHLLIKVLNINNSE